MTRRNLLRPCILRLLLSMTVSSGCLLLTAIPAQSQGGSGQVTITPADGKVIAWSAAGGGVEESLEPGESIVFSEARGHTGFVQTTSRLLGFSAGLRQWRDVSLGVEERMGRHRLLPFLILAHSNQQVYGFQETRGHWTTASPAPNETVFSAPRSWACRCGCYQRTGAGFFDLHRRLLRYQLDDK